jgi:aminoglycoside phosphotransferase (APT) family kinase protein
VVGDSGIESVTLDQLAARADFVSLHCPLSEETRGLIDTRFLAAMKPTAYLLNTARGAIVDHKALARALREGRIAGAGLDVFEYEPLPSDHPLLSSDRLIATPHVAFYSEESLASLARSAAENVAAILDNRRPPSVVNPEALLSARWRSLRREHEPEVAAPAGRLDPSQVVDFLKRRGLIVSANAKVEILGGGVSNDVLAIDDGRQGLIIKQPLARLQVSDDWFAPRDRALGEADAIELCGRLTPNRTPRLIYRDDDRFVIVIERAPSGWSDWKTRLLSGEIDPAVASWLGRTLAAWHTATDKKPLSRRLETEEVFKALRIDPYYRAVAVRAPEHADRIQDLIAASARRRSCFVHGDFSPKNILVGPGDAGWVIDFEVAHRGDPAFDVAFLLCHLTAKAVHRRDDADKFDICSREFAVAYMRSGGVVEWPHTLAHVGALLLARVGGKSPVEYLSAADRGRAWRLGSLLLEAPPGSIDELIALRKKLLS